jgi:hypothetical protein
MQMLYNSDNFAVVHFDLPQTQGEPQADGQGTRAHGGYEIVDKSARREIFIEGALAEQFKLGVDALIETGPTEEQLDAYVERFAALAQQPVVLH